MKRWVILMTMILSMFSFTSMALAQESNVMISPDKVNVGLNFKGADLTINGNLPEGADVYIKVSSPADSMLDLSKKGKVGVFWMNVENTSVTNVPKLFQIVSSKPVKNIPSDLQSKLGLNENYSQVYSQAKVTIQSDQGEKSLSKDKAKAYIDSLINIYQKAGLYYIGDKDVAVKGNQFTAKVKLPPNIPQEQCTVSVYMIKDGQLLSTTNKSFQVGSIGVVKMLNTLAIYDGPTYGFIAVIIALAVGIGIAFLFMFLEGGKSPSTSH